MTEEEMVPIVRTELGKVYTIAAWKPVGKRPLGRPRKINLRDVFFF
jgi:hypothetical protein